MYKYLFANIPTKSEDDIYPVTVSEIAEAQMKHRVFRKYFSKKAFKNRDKHIRSVVINRTRVLVYKDMRLVIPTERMQNKIVTWYHYYLLHPGAKPAGRDNICSDVVARYAPPY